MLGFKDLAEDCDWNDQISFVVVNRICDQADVAMPKQTGSGLGLSGLQERVESLGGSFSSAQNQPHGTIITMQLNLDPA